MNTRDPSLRTETLSSSPEDRATSVLQEGAVGLRREDGGEGRFRGSHVNPAQKPGSKAGSTPKQQGFRCAKPKPSKRFFLHALDPHPTRTARPQLKSAAHTTAQDGLMVCVSAHRACGGTVGARRKGGGAGTQGHPRSGILALALPPPPPPSCGPPPRTTHCVARCGPCLLQGNETTPN